MELKEIGELIRERRKFLKLRLEDLSELSGVNKRTVHLVEQGTANPSIDTLQKIAKVTGLELKLEIKKIN